MQRPLNILTVLFGHIGDTLMAAALFDDVLTLKPEASFLILTRRNTALIRDLVAAYPAIEVRQIPKGFKTVPFFIGLVTNHWIFLALGLGTALEYSIRLKLFLFLLSVIPGNQLIGLGTRSKEAPCWQPLTRIIARDDSATMLDNFRALLPATAAFDPHALADVAARPLILKLKICMPQHFPYKPHCYIVVHLFGVSRYRSFPLLRWKSLLASIAHCYSDMPIVFTGSAEDRILINEVARVIPGSHISVGLPLLQVAGIIDGAALYIGVDTGITHLAGVLKQKSIVIRHVGDPRWIPTYNPNARIIVNTQRCNCLSDGNCSIEEDGVLYTRCMYDITDKAILDSVQLALSLPQRNIPSFAGLIDEYHE